MGGKTSEKPFEFLVYLDSSTFELFIKAFKVNEMISEAVRDFARVKEVFLE